MTAPNDNSLDRTFAALAHPTRRAIVSRLAKGDAASVTELADPFDVSLMAISKHLRVLEEAGLVVRQKDGRIQRCTFDPAAMNAASSWIEYHRRFWAGRLDSLSRYMEAPSSNPHENHQEGESK